MASPALELQGAIVARLKTDPSVIALLNGRVYDDVPSDETRKEKTGASFPYVSMGPRDELSDDADCVTGFEIALQIDVWSRAVGFPEAQSIADAVRKSLVEYEFPEMENPIVLFRHDQTRLFRDPDGLTTHAAMAFEAFAEQP
jgi:hypothetical protein